MRVDPSYTSNLVGALDQAQSNSQQLSSELSSGVSVTSLGSNPVAAGENVLLLNQIQQDDSFTQSSSLVTGQLQVADSALGQVVTQLTQAISLATSANNGTMNASDDRSIASQLSGIQAEVLSLANSNYQGQYIFAGTSQSGAPFTLSTATSPATVTYNGDQDVNYLETPNGQSIQLNVPGNQIFSAAGENNVFAALNNLIADYSAGTVNTGASGERYDCPWNRLELRFPAAGHDRQFHHPANRRLQRRQQRADAIDCGADQPDAGRRGPGFHAIVAL